MSYWTKRIEKITNDCIEFIKDYVNNISPDKKVVIGISGGVDSTVVAALCEKALGRERVLGVMLPQGDQHDIDCSKQIIDYLQIESMKINIDKVVKSISNRLEHAMGVDVNKNSVYRSNTPARVRMTILYGIAALVDGLVVNTCNRSENYIGYSTKFGDHAGDFSPLWNLTKLEVKAIGKYLELPEDLVEKTPEDGLSGKTDEENLGFTYDELDFYLFYGETTALNENIDKIEKLHKQNLHKMNPMPAYEPEKFNPMGEENE